jgi:hypothetical protein
MWCIAEDCNGCANLESERTYVIHRLWADEHMWYIVYERTNICDTPFVSGRTYVIHRETRIWKRTDICDTPFVSGRTYVIHRWSLYCVCVNVKSERWTFSTCTTQWNYSRLFRSIGSWPALSCDEFEKVRLNVLVERELFYVWRLCCCISSVFVWNAERRIVIRFWCCWRVLW